MPLDSHRTAVLMPESPERNEVLEEELRKLQERLKHLEVNLSKDAKDLSSTEITSREMKSQEFQEGMCPVHLDESIWSIAVVIGLEHSMFNGFFDFFVSAILAMVTAVTQILLGVALYAGWLRPEVQVSDANSWRNLLAHDAKYVDLSGNSLATQACSAAYSGFAGPAGSMIQEINLYLGLSNEQFDMSTFRPGTIVCVLCILIWSLCVMKELRSYWLMIQAIFWIPRAAMSEMEGTLALSCNRVWMLISLYALRTSISLGLLGGGIRLLGNTTSLLQMILITAALPVILNIDKQFFRAVMPMEIKIGIQRFKPFRIHYSRLHSQIETFVAVFLVLAVLLVSYSEVVRVFEEGILDIKVQLCGGQQAFVVAHNPSSQLTYALQTGTTQGAAVQAVELYRYSSPSSPSSPWVILSSEESFQTQASRGMKEEAALALCWEEQTDTSSSQLARNAAALALKHNETTASCQDLAQKCQEPSARLLRMACGVTCGCSEPHSSPWYKVEAQGCSSACLASASSTASVIPCQDMDKANQTWQDLWDEYMPALTDFLTLSGNETTALLQTVQDMKSQGCAFLLQQQFEPATGAKWCEGHPELFRPLSYLCPLSCGGCR